MNIKNIVCIACLAFIYSKSLLAEDSPIKLTDKQIESAFKLAEGLADCAGVAYGLEEIFKEKGGTKYLNLATSIRENGNGATLAGSYLLYSAGLIKNWDSAILFTEEKSKSEKTRWLAMTESMDLANVLKQMDEETKKCNEVYGEIQENLVKELRRDMYSNMNTTHK